MSVFHSILSQLKARFDAHTDHSRTIAAYISETVGISLSEESISYNKNIVRLLVSPTIKMAILLKKDILLKLLNEKGISVTSIQ